MRATRFCLRGSLRFAVGSVVLAILSAGCGDGTSGPDAIGSTGTTAEEVTMAPAAGGDQAVVEAAADSWPEPQDVPYDYHSLPHEEWMRYCAEAFGFATTEIATVPGSPPNFVVRATGAQNERWAEVGQLCTREAEERGWVTPMNLSTEAQLRARYERLLAANDCLTGLGYGTEPMSWDTYQEARDWNVYANTPFGSTLVITPYGATDLSEDAQRQLAIQEACPWWGPLD